MKEKNENLKKKKKNIDIADNNYLKYIPVLFTAIFIIIAFLNRDKITVENILKFTPENLFLAALVLLALFAVKSVSIVFPLAVLYIVSGKIFNIGLALFVNILGLIITLTIPYLMGRFSGEDLVDKIKIKYPKTERIDELKTENKWVFVFVFRIIKVIPGDVGSIVLGAINTEYIVYLIVSLLIRIPPMITMTIFGNNITNPRSPQFILSLVARVLISIASYIAVYIINKRSKADKKEKQKLK